MWGRVTEGFFNEFLTGLIKVTSQEDFIIELPYHSRDIIWGLQNSLHTLDFLSFLYLWCLLYIHNVYWCFLGMSQDEPRGANLYRTYREITEKEQSRSIKRAKRSNTSATYQLCLAVGVVLVCSEFRSWSKMWVKSTGQRQRVRL